MKLNLTLYQTRVLGALIEKEITTPDQYPLSLNALTSACNQKSNREPVLQLTDAIVQDTVDQLKVLRFIRDETGYGSRVVKLKHRFCNTEFTDFKFTEQELGIICVLFLRGPQTPGELRTRTNRLCSFANVSETESVLNTLSRHEHGPYVVKLERETGKRDSRYAHLFSGDIEVAAQPESTPLVASASSSTQSQDQRLGDLEEQVKWLKGELAMIKSELGLGQD
ncbi:MAG: hypothetical protein ACI9FJ_001270 [Alteromonadaceae bacterium]|jgi:uncharacterized protein YceH (UPF0502 family)